MHVTGSGPISGLVMACRTIYLEDGIRGFYRGCATNLLRTTPAAALTFTSYELIRRHMQEWAEQQRQLEQQQCSSSSLAPRVRESQLSISLPGRAGTADEG